MKIKLIISLLFLVLQNVIAQKYTFQAPKMGTLIQVTIADQDSLTAYHAAQEVFLLYDTLNQILSDYLPDSELNQLCNKAGNGEWMEVSNYLLNVINLSQQAYNQSNGAFDPSVGQLIKLWRTARKEKVFPDKKLFTKAKQTQGFELNKDIEINKNKVRLNNRGVQLDFGGIAKGYAAQMGIERLKNQGITAVLIDSGGDLMLGDAPKNTLGWNIAINQPNDANELLHYLTLSNVSVATSGHLFQSVNIGGKNYSHIIDPKTGIGLTHQKNVTVIAKDGATADWLATACSVMSFKKAIKLIKQTNKTITSSEQQVKLLITYWKKDKIKEQKLGSFERISLN